MRAIQRLYVYTAMLVAVQVVLWALTTLLGRVLLGSGSIDQITFGIAWLVVGIPFFAIHLRLIRRSLTAEPAERGTAVRIVFLNALVLINGIVAVQNLFALGMRVLFAVVSRGDHPWVLLAATEPVTQVVAGLLYAAAAAYAAVIARRERLTLAPAPAADVVHDVFRHLWYVYALVPAVLGGYDVVRVLGQALFVASAPNEQWWSNAQFLASVVFVVVGLPLWLFCAWMVRREVAGGRRPFGSTPNIFVNYAVGFAAQVVSMPAAIALIGSLFAMLNQPGGGDELRSELALRFSALLVAGVVWWYHARRLAIVTAQYPDATKRPMLRRGYWYLGAAAGLTAVVAGSGLVVDYIIDVARSGGGSLSRFGAVVAVPVVGVAVWLPLWSTVGRDVATGAVAARRSLIRRSYLYAVIFAAVLGLVVATGMVVFGILSPLLNQGRWSAVDIQTAAVFAGVFALALWYHRSQARRDNIDVSVATAVGDSAFPEAERVHTDAADAPVAAATADDNAVVTQPVRVDAEPDAAALPPLVAAGWRTAAIVMIVVFSVQLATVLLALVFVLRGGF